jgi:hypothetical protein
MRYSPRESRSSISAFIAFTAVPSALLCRSYALRRRQAYGGRWKLAKVKISYFGGRH